VYGSTTNAITNCFHRTEAFLRSWGILARKESLPTVHYRVHKKPINPIHNLPPYICTTDFD